MIKQTLLISENRADLRLSQGQLLFNFDDPSGALPRSRPCEDIGLLVIDNPHTTISAALVSELADKGAAILYCDGAHLPRSLVLPLSRHCNVVHRLNDQIACTKPRKKRIWQQIIQAKLKHQAQVLEPYNASTAQRIAGLVRKVQSGDPQNCEAQGAKLYFQALFADTYAQGFRREPTAKDSLNSALNYGYAILRALVARALVIAGLQPTLGIFHHQRSNPFCLADELLEPLRPLVDPIVKNLDLSANLYPQEGLTKSIKASLLVLPKLYVGLKERSSGPLMVQLSHYLASFHRCITAEEDTLQIPSLEAQPNLLKA